MSDYVDNVLLTLGEIVRTTTNERLRGIAKHAADKLFVAIEDFYSLPTRENLQTLNGLWAIGQRVIDVWTAPEPTPPRAAGQRPADLGAGEASVFFTYDDFKDEMRKAA